MTSPPAAAGTVAFRRLLPEPARLWIRFAPRAWVADAGRRVDLVSLGLFREAGGPALPEAPPAPLDDVLYLPPVPAAWRQARDELARACLEAGTPVLAQARPAESPPPGVVACDLLEPLLAGDVGPLGEAPAGCVAIWPLVGGLTDGPALQEAGLERLAGAGVAAVCGLALELPPAARRRLAEGLSEGVFEALFHRPAPSERELARRAASQGLAWWLDRPLPAPPGACRNNRLLAGALIAIGDLSLRLGRPEQGAHETFGAARRIDESHHDFLSLAREGNLGVVTWLPGEAAAVVRELATEGASSLLAGLRREYAQR